MYGYDNAPMPVNAPMAMAPSYGTFCGGGYPYAYAGAASGGYGYGGFALIVVLFILLIIIGACYN
ncbi:hypothetical protein UB32_09740 [Mesobacillus subterraneus]|uniref:YjcZ family sporulation protein n=2 Tax=Mesobacillus TaxID=2675231 RepID=A0A0D6Z9U1_9BACI|nr:hypothetical protein UB32_09740 [Mesobacillus subterraneus]MDQ0411997.1 uncharacterized protein (TIGR01732 family) [Mesobacillus stamsii]